MSQPAAPDAISPSRAPARDIRLVLGTMSFGDTADLETARAAIDYVLGVGVTEVDTANTYDEEALAPVIAGRRDRIRLASKVGMAHPDAADHPPLSARALRAALDGTLRRLGTDHVDVLYLHKPGRDTPLTETLHTVFELRAEGKVGDLGISNFSAWQTLDVIRCATEVGTPGPVIAQQLYNLVARRIEDEFLEFARVHDVLLTVYNPLAGGLLAGPPTDDHNSAPARFTSSWLAAAYRQRYWNPEVLNAVRKLAHVADEAGVSMPELSLRWLASQETVRGVLLGGDRLEHFTSNVEAVRRGPLSADVLTACDEATRPLAGHMPAYNR
jgi:aryl-alcohol dehydrogenase-like predicted oxidoreductase